MAAPTEVYVDPSIAGDSGTGTSGDPYGDLQYALNNTTLGGGGTRMNIKAGTDEVLSSALSLAGGFSGTPSLAAPLIFQGYTSTAGDGGQGGISGNGSVGIWSNSSDGIWFRDMHLHNCGSATIWTNTGANGWRGLIECELDNTTGDGIVDTTPRALQIVGCNIYNIGGDGIRVTSSTLTQGILIAHNYFANATNDFVDAMDIQQGGAAIIGNIFNLDGSSNGIKCATGNGVLGAFIMHNSVLSSGTAGTGIDVAQTTTNALNSFIANNLVEGFATGIKYDTTNRISVFAANSVYNSATADFSGNTDHLFDLYDYNESLGATPFDKSGSNTFANRFTYYAPADTGTVQGGAYPSGCRRDRGAVQHADPAGGGGGTVNLIHGKMG